ncbi:thioredoxin family protein [Croceibacter atlanticus]|jgi:hypothetical protein|uniref:thioredoxin family protein n=1 Tax=Croceibacter atlanticus TaxID=313588 RepID=UPI0024BB6AD6|nr:thioredoxin family protein [Croceibacter atlanticus]WSP35640.1 thioredoxin family protein [Croceibacter atlanticus]
MSSAVLQIVKESLKTGMSYDTYRTLVSNLILQNKSTGNEQTEALLDYSVLNDRRMKRLGKTIKISENAQQKFEAFKTPITFLVITEGWCGDAAQILPVIQKIVELNSNFNLKIVLRDEHPELMSCFLTNGGKAIPKVILYNEATDSIDADWGPRPSVATKMVADYKALHGVLDPEFKEHLQVWYNKDKGETIINDFLTLLEPKIILA